MTVYIVDIGPADDGSTVIRIPDLPYRFAYRDEHDTEPALTELIRVLNGNPGTVIPSFEVLADDLPEELQAKLADPDFKPIAEIPLGGRKIADVLSSVIEQFKEVEDILGSVSDDDPGT